jgi:hypothetical protein
MDAIEYYGYLPAFFIYHQPAFQFLNKPTPPGFISKFWVKPQPGKKYVTRMTLGCAFIVAPGFLAGHLYSKITGSVQDGFQKPYLTGVWIWIQLLILFSLFIIKKILDNYHFNIYIQSATVLILVMGTNLFNYITFEAFMTHAVNFFLCAMLIYSTLKWYSHQTIILLFGIAFSLSFLILIRPTNAVLLCVPLFWGIAGMADFKQRLGLFKLKKYHVFLAVLIPAFVFTVQLIYWKIETGHFIYNGYEGEKFFFKHWLLPEYLFSYRKGWFLYTPLALLALLGLLIKTDVLKGKKLLIIFIIFGIAYVHSCWWCWWFGGGFGARSMVDFYPLLALPLAALLQFISEKKWLIKIPATAIICFLLILNLKQSGQYRGGLLHWDAMSKKAYWGIFLKNNPPPGYEKMLSPTDAMKAKAGFIYH